MWWQRATLFTSGLMSRRHSPVCFGHSATRQNSASHRWYLAALAIVLLTGCGATPGGSGGAAERAQKITVMFKALNEDVQPGAAVMVIERGKITYARGFGYADLARGTPITASSSFRLASVSKQFTAAAVVLLAQEGKLDYDDPIVKYLPRLTGYPGVSIRHLLTHTAGLPDYYDAFDTSERMPANADLVEFLATAGTAQFAPGERFEYSNPAYEMLALIVERAAGVTFRHFMSTQIFWPAGMKQALVYDHTRPHVDKRVLGYEQRGGEYVLNDEDPWNGVIGSGGVYASLEDLYAWDLALYADRVVPQAGLAQAWSKSTLNDGSSAHNYGFGWRLDSYLGHARVAHGGAWVGFRTHIARYPDHQLTIVVLSNRAEFEPGKHIDAISDLYLPSVTPDR